MVVLESSRGPDWAARWAGFGLHATSCLSLVYKVIISIKCVCIVVTLSFRRDKLVIHFFSSKLFHFSSVFKNKKKSCSSKCSVLLLFFFSVRSPSITIFLGYKLHHRFWHQHGGDMLPSLESNPLEFRITVISAGRCVCVFPTELLCYSTVKRKKKERKN